tara:strand:- start:2456 stop:3286 length:831 start_codon:yes stop_codon:yes gene_type:complete
MIELGKYNTLRADRNTEPGVYLEDESGEAVLLPHKYVPLTLRLGDMLDVFIYADNENRLIATTLKPNMCLHEFGLLKVNSVTNYGAFAEWGVAKDLLIPLKEQAKKLQEGQTTIGYLFVDEVTGRLTASTKLARYMSDEKPELNVGDEVEILVADGNDLGVQVIVNNKHWGMVFDSDIIEPLMRGSRQKAYVRKVREDNKIDIALEKDGYQKVEPNAQRILDAIDKNGGVLNLTDKSDPEDIRDQLVMSKKTFKKAVGLLYKEKRIVIDDTCLRMA